MIRFFILSINEGRDTNEKINEKFNNKSPSPVTYNMYLLLNSVNCIFLVSYPMKENKKKVKYSNNAMPMSDINQR